MYHCSIVNAAAAAQAAALTAAFHNPHVITHQTQQTTADAPTSSLLAHNLSSVVSSVSEGANFPDTESSNLTGLQKEILDQVNIRSILMQQQIQLAGAASIIAPTAAPSREPTNTNRDSNSDSRISEAMSAALASPSVSTSDRIMSTLLQSDFTTTISNAIAMDSNTVKTSDSTREINAEILSFRDLFTPEMLRHLPTNRVKTPPAVTEAVQAAVGKIHGNTSIDHSAFSIPNRYNRTSTATAIGGGLYSMTSAHIAEGDTSINCSSPFLGNGDRPSYQGNQGSFLSRRLLNYPTNNPHPYKIYSDGSQTFYNKPVWSYKSPGAFKSDYLSQHLPSPRINEPTYNSAFTGNSNELCFRLPANNASTISNRSPSGSRSRDPGKNNLSPSANSYRPVNRLSKLDLAKR